ncbi:MAG TPA: ATP-binding protein [Vicinamibacterales bacterium]|nr:ATP-binding protein [Vicinamibacterales bacterium]
MAVIPRLRDWPWALKLVTLLVSLAIVPVGALSIYSVAVLRNQMVSEASARNLQRARNTVTLLDGYLADLVADLTIVAHALPTIGVLRGDEARRAELQKLLDDFTATKGLSMLFVLDDTGTIAVATRPDLVGSSRRSTPFFLSAVAGRVQTHDPRFVPQEGGVYMHASVPVRDERNQIIGVVAARIPLTEIDRLIAADTNFGSLREFGMLWNEHGIVISSPAAPGLRFRPLGTLARAARDRMVAESQFGPNTASLLAAPGPADELVKNARWRMYDERADPISRTDLGDGLSQVASVAMRDRGWTYGVFAKERDVLAQFQQQSNRNLTAALLTALAAFGLATISARLLSRPLDRIREAARALAAGDMRRRVGLGRADEIGQVADAFDSMADELARKDAELRHHADSLERHVADRTAELSGLLAAIPDLIFKVGRDGRLLDYVASKEGELAIPPERFLGQRLTDILPPDVSLPALSAVTRALAGESVPPFEYRLQLGRDLKHFEARASASGPDSVVFLIRNITDRRHHEERMRFLARAGSTLTASLDYSSIVETLTQLPVPFMADACLVDLLEHGTLRCAAVAARTPELQSMVRAVRTAFPVDPASDHPVAVALRSGALRFEEVGEDVFAAAAASAEHRALIEAIAAASLMVLPLVARGETLGVMSFVSTNPRRRYSEDDLAVAQELAHRAGIALENARLYRDVQEASRAKDEFLGIVSHELRTPLNAVLGWAQVLRRAPADPEQMRRAMEAIERNAQAQAQLVEDLLDTSRAISGKIRLEPQPVSINSLVGAAVESFGPTARAAGVDLSVQIDGGVGEIQADPGRLHQVIGNLISNALKFTPAGGRIEASTRRAADTIEIRIVDTGSGIDPDFLPHVFDRFRQADSTTTRAHGGLGIGLAIARHLVELHGGTILAASEGIDKGATFTIVLPAGSRPQTGTQPSIGHASESLAGKCVLAACDTVEPPDALLTALRSAGAEIVTVSRIEHGLEQLERLRPDVLVADIGIAGDAFETLIGRIRAHEAQAGAARLPSVALSGQAGDEARARWLAAGFDEHMSKPVEPRALVSALRELLSRHAGELAT